MTAIEIITLIIALYGAFLSTFTFIDRFTRISVDYEVYLFATEDKVMHFALSLIAVNRGKNEVYLKCYGLLIDGNEIELQLVPKSLVNSASETNLNLSANQLVPLKANGLTLIRDTRKLLPSQSSEDYFFIDSIRQHPVFNESKELELYIKSENGKRFKVIIPTEKFKSITKEF